MRPHGLLEKDQAFLALTYKTLVAIFHPVLFGFIFVRRICLATHLKEVLLCFHTCVSGYLSSAWTYALVSLAILKGGGAWVAVSRHGTFCLGAVVAHVRIMYLFEPNSIFDFLLPSRILRSYFIPSNKVMEFMIFINHIYLNFFRILM